MKKLLIGIALMVAVFVGVGSLLPSRVQVERDIVIDRPPATVFAVLNSFRRFNEWSPWARRDPDAEYTLSGPDRGVGARLTWSGDPRRIGTGSQEIIRSEPLRLVAVELDFGSQGVADASWRLEPAGDGTRVTWTFASEVTDSLGWFDGLVWRWMGLLFDRWVGADYEQGLVNLEQLLESMPAADFSDLDVRVEQVPDIDILYVSGQTSQDPSDIEQALANAYGEITAYMAERDIEPTGEPLAVTHAWDGEGYRFDAAIPAATAGLSPAGRVRIGHTPSGRGLRVVHRGSYDTLTTTYDRLDAWMAAHGVRQDGVSWEHYLSDPADVPESELVTHIYVLTGERP